MNLAVSFDVEDLGENHRDVVARVGGDAVGRAELSWNVDAGEGRLWIGNICTNPKHRRQGIGTRLVVEALRVGTEVWSASEVYIDAQPGTEGFWKAFGFERRTPAPELLCARGLTGQLMARCTSIGGPVEATP